MTAAVTQRLGRLLALVLLAHANGAIAQAFEPFDFDVFARARYDSNLFRLPDGVQPGGRGDRSVLSGTTGFGVRFDKSYGLQRVIVDASVMRDFYSGYRNLDYTGNQLAFTYDWSLTPSISGDIIVKHSNVPTDFAYSGYQTSPNPTKSDLRRVDAEWRPGAALHPRFSVFQQEDRTSQPLFQQQSSRSTSVEASLIYEFRSGNKAEFYARKAHGTSDGQFDQDVVTLTDPDFTEREYGLRTSWTVTGVSKFSGSIGYLDHTHRTFAVRNFDGIVGSVDYVYTISGKSSVEVTAGRSLGSSQTLFSSYVLDESLAATATYLATSKISVRPSLSVSRRAYLQSPFASNDELRQVVRSASLTVGWAVLRSVDLDLSLAASKRTSNNAAFQYRDRAAYVGSQFKF